MRLEELIRSSEASRLRLTEAHAHLKHRFDFTGRAKEALMENPGKLLGGILAAGGVWSLLLRKKKKPTRVQELKRQRGFLLGLLSLALTLGRPLVKVYATKLLKDYLATRYAAGTRGRLGNAKRPPY